MLEWFREVERTRLMDKLINLKNDSYKKFYGILKSWFEFKQSSIYIGYVGNKNVLGGPFFCNIQELTHTSTLLTLPKGYGKPPYNPLKVCHYVYSSKYHWKSSIFSRPTSTSLNGSAKESPTLEPYIKAPPSCPSKNYKPITTLDTKIFLNTSGCARSSLRYNGLMTYNHGI